MLSTANIQKWILLLTLGLFIIAILALLLAITYSARFAFNGLSGLFFLQVSL